MEDLGRDTPNLGDLTRRLRANNEEIKHVESELTRLDAESTLGGGPLSGGRDSGIVAIQPPNQYPRQLWDKLAEQGKLRRVGGGLYELAQDPNVRRD